MYIYPYTDELYHYGIKGQKWGVRRFQDKNGTLTSAGKNRYSDNHSKETLTPEEAARKAKIKKRIVIGATVVGTVLVVYGGYKAYELYTGRKQQIDPSTGFRMLNKNMTDEEHLNAINPGRIRMWSRDYKDKAIIHGSSHNCMLCTTSYDLRKRGYDVRAGRSMTGYMPDELFSKIYKNYNGTKKITVSHLDLLKSGESHSSSMFNHITDYIKNEGPGSRGNVMVWWKHGAGHSMIWENVDGKIKFMDGQTGQEYKDFAKDILEYANISRPVELLRTDNLDINLSEMKKVVNTNTVFKTYVDHGAEIALNMATDPGVVAAAGATYIGYKGYNKYSTHKNTVSKNIQGKGGPR